MCPSGTHGGVPAKSAETHILSFIWYAANKTCMRNVASRFDLSERSVYRIRHTVADFLLTLGQSLIKFPADLENLTRSFEKVSGMPDVVGCIDGSYIKIQCPEKKVASTYCNRHHYLSLTLQAVCDDKRRFLDTFIGSSSKMHDSYVFSLSPLSKKISAVCQGSYHILGDADILEPEGLGLLGIGSFVNPWLGARLSDSWLSDAWMVDAGLSDAWLIDAGLADAWLADAWLADAWLAGLLTATTPELSLSSSGSRLSSSQRVPLKRFKRRRSTSGTDFGESIRGGAKTLSREVKLGVNRGLASCATSPGTRHHSTVNDGFVEQIMAVADDFCD
ncbi:uncharacterized protein LOC142574709 [Dermacentor variabilis]|uniref:uncharacterized protein LOC142574709 n=1 Tax=Dermacentor variabilis TaxID=34621 RepID=UPI003F5BF448